MSPTEDQLRRALRDGEGAGPDPDDVVRHAIAYRSQRRVRIASTVAVVAVVAGIGVGVGVAAGGSAHHPAHSGSALKPVGTGEAARAPSSGAGAGNAAGGAASMAQPASCPATLPAIPRGSGTADLYTHALTSVRVCGYLGTGVAVAESATGQPLTRTFTGSDATAIEHAVNSGATTNPTVSCKALPANGLHALLLLGRYDSGAAAPSVLLGVGCDNVTTNGFDVRYDVSTPAPLRDFVSTLQRAATSAYSRPSIAPSPATS
jgi:hypothetical protein